MSRIYHPRTTYIGIPPGYTKRRAFIEGLLLCAGALLGIIVASLWVF